jgi:hypothetical protein
MYCVVLLMRKETGHLENQGVDECITLILIFNKWGSRVWTGFKWFELWTISGLLCLLQ